MKKRQLAGTDLNLSVLGFGASSIGGEFHKINIDKAFRSVRTALDRGMNFIDTATYYGRGLSECLLGQVLPDVPRDSYLLSTKLGRFAPTHFDFSAKRVAESVDLSLQRMHVEHLDIVFCHDIEFVDLNQIVDETLPALRKEVEKGKVRYVGVSGYPMKIFTKMMTRADLDVVLTYNHYTLQNDMALSLVEPCRENQVGLINAAPFSARLLTSAKLPVWHQATAEVREVAARAVQHCIERGSDIAKLALQYSVANEDFSSCVTGSADPSQVDQWCDWLDEPLDEPLVKEVKEILQPIHNWFYVDGRPENCDSMSPRNWKSESLSPSPNPLRS